MTCTTGARSLQPAPRRQRAPRPLYRCCSTFGSQSRSRSAGRSTRVRREGLPGPPRVRHPWRELAASTCPRARRAAHGPRRPGAAAASSVGGTTSLVASVKDAARRLRRWPAALLYGRSSFGNAQGVVFAGAKTHALTRAAAQARGAVPPGWTLDHTATARGECAGGRACKDRRRGELAHLEAKPQGGRICRVALADGTPYSGR